MNITFHGAAHGVTGSCHLVETTSKKRILFDCGMFQGKEFNEQKNDDPFGFDPKTIDAVILSHAHVDHSGRIPKLVKEGFSGPIYMTSGTKGLARIIWEDAARIMAYNNKKYKKPVLFTEDDVARAVNQCEVVSYDEQVQIEKDITFVLKDAGHILGASFIELQADNMTVGFSGDLGNVNVPILKESMPLGEVDVLLLESTYGNRLHETEKERKELFLDIVKQGCADGGVIMMPAFSIERTQEILYTLNELREHDKTLPNMPIYVDSPMAIRALEVYKEHPEYYDEAAKKRVSWGDDFLDFPGLTLTLSKEESMRINNAPAPKMIIAGSGMMSGGRILHHAKRYLPDPKSRLVLVGYQAEETLGRQLLEGAKEVTIHDAVVPVHAQVQAIGALSAHADQDKLVSWVKEAKSVPKHVICVHGEYGAAEALATRLEEELQITTSIPEVGETIHIDESGKIS